MRVLVTGSRNWTDAAAVEDYLATLERPLVVVHGDYPTGVDAIAKAWADRTPGVVQEPHPANWQRHGRKAGPLRNAAMVRIHRTTPYALCIGFPLGESRGTRGCMTLAEYAGIRTVNRGDA